MTLLLTTFIMMAFSGVYAAVLAMLGNRSAALVSALRGRSGQRLQPQLAGNTLAASRRFSRA